MVAIPYPHPSTGILEDSNTAFNCYVAGAVFCLFAHFYYLWNIPSRVAELKKQDPNNKGGGGHIPAEYR